MLSNLDALAHGFCVALTVYHVALTVYHVALMLAGVLLGVLVGVLPGLGAPNGVTLLLPLTFSMDPVSAVILLTSLYWGALFGGSTTSILFNIPGEPSSVATTFDDATSAEPAPECRRRSAACSTERATSGPRGARVMPAGGRDPASAAVRRPAAHRVAEAHGVALAGPT